MDFDDRFRRSFIIFLVVAVAVIFLGMIRDFLTALILAAVFSGLLYPLHTRLRDFLRGRVVLSATIVLIVAVLAVMVPLTGLLSIVAAEALLVGQQLQPAFEEALSGDIPLKDRVPDWVPFIEALEPFREDIQNKITEAATSAGSWLVQHVATATRGTLGFLVGLFVTLYAMFFFLINGPELLRSTKALVPLSVEDRDTVMDRGLSVAQASLKGIIVIGAIQGILVGVGLWACGINSPAFWGVVVFVLSAIPSAGAPIVWLPASLYLMIYGETAWGIGLALWGAIVVGMVDNLLRPMLVGRDAKLPDLVILISVLGGIATFGAVGIILGPIIAAILDTVLNIYKRAFAESLPS